MRSQCPITARLVLLQDEEEEEREGRSGVGGWGVVAGNEPRCATETSSSSSVEVKNTAGTSAVVAPVVKAVLKNVALTNVAISRVSLWTGNLKLKDDRETFSLRVL